MVYMTISSGICLSMSFTRQPDISALELEKLLYVVVYILRYTNMNQSSQNLVKTCITINLS